MSVRLDVIVPCYNPPIGWESALVARFVAFQEAAADVADDIRLIVVNDGSPHNATELNFNRLKEILPKVSVVSYEVNRGKGHALRQGVATSEADYQLVTDADFPYTVESMRQVAIVLRESGGIVAGNRDTAYYDRVPMFRRWLSKALRWVLRNLLRQPVDDSQCGLKGFDRAGKTVFLQTTIDRFLFDLEFLMLANGKVKVTPVPVQLRDGVVFSQVGLKILATEGGNFLKLLFK
jgi:glycosyltransferase involved in cell wall biosynthesis